MENLASTQIPDSTADKDTVLTLETTKNAIRLFHTTFNALRPGFNSKSIDTPVERLEELKQNYNAATKADIERELAAFKFNLAKMEVQGAPKEEDLDQLLNDWIDDIMASGKEGRVKSDKMKKEFYDLISEIGEKIGVLEKKWREELEEANIEEKHCQPVMKVLPRIAELTGRARHSKDEICMDSSKQKSTQRFTTC